MTTPGFSAQAALGRKCLDYQTSEVAGFSPGGHEVSPQLPPPCAVYCRKRCSLRCAGSLSSACYGFCFIQCVDLNC
jgi:hypothetical protein